MYKVFQKSPHYNGLMEFADSTKLVKFLTTFFKTTEDVNVNCVLSATTFDQLTMYGAKEVIFSRKDGVVLATFFVQKHPTPQVVNVVEMIDNNPKVKSFIVPVGDGEQEAVKSAEDYFITCLENAGVTVLNEEERDFYLDENSYEDHGGYSIYLTWSQSE